MEWIAGTIAQSWKVKSLDPSDSRGLQCCYVGEGECHSPSWSSVKSRRGACKFPSSVLSLRSAVVLLWFVWRLWGALPLQLPVSQLEGLRLRSHPWFSCLLPCKVFLRPFTDLISWRQGLTGCVVSAVFFHRISKMSLPDFLTWKSVCTFTALIKTGRSVGWYQRSTRGKVWN